jgi:hypothetical protein
MSEHIEFFRDNFLTFSEHKIKQLYGIKLMNYNALTLPNEIKCNAINQLQAALVAAIKDKDFTQIDILIQGVPDYVKHRNNHITMAAYARMLKEIVQDILPDFKPTIEFKPMVHQFGILVGYYTEIFIKQRFK